MAITLEQLSDRVYEYNNDVDTYSRTDQIIADNEELLLDSDRKHSWETIWCYLQNIAPYKYGSRDNAMISDGWCEFLVDMYKQHDVRIKELTDCLEMLEHIDSRTHKNQAILLESIDPNNTNSIACEGYTLNTLGAACCVLSAGLSIFYCLFHPSVLTGVSETVGSACIGGCSVYKGASRLELNNLRDSARLLQRARQNISTIIDGGTPNESNSMATVYSKMKETISNIPGVSNPSFYDAESQSTKRISVFNGIDAAAAGAPEAFRIDIEERNNNTPEVS